MARAITLYDPCFNTFFVFPSRQAMAKNLVETHDLYTEQAEQTRNRDDIGEERRQAMLRRIDDRIEGVKALIVRAGFRDLDEARLGCVDFAPFFRALAAWAVTQFGFDVFAVSGYDDVQTYLQAREDARGFFNAEV